MCIGHTFEEQVIELKKSIAKMMVYWFAQTRDDLRQGLVARDIKAWAGLALPEAFRRTGEEGIPAEWVEFFNQASTLFNEEAEIAGGAKVNVVKAGAERIYKRVYGIDGLGPGDWCPSLDPCCTSNSTFNIMFYAALAFVDCHLSDDWPKIPVRELRSSPSTQR